MGFIFLLGRQYLQEKIICLYPASGQKIGQYFFIQMPTIYYITDEKKKKEITTIVHSAKKGNKKWYTSLIKVH